MGLKYKILLVLAALLPVVVLGVSTSTPAHAASGYQWCDDLGYCPNAWNGGPFVKSYGYPARNNDFTWVPDYNMCNGGFTTSTCPGHGIPSGYPIGQFEFTGSGSWVGNCIGDAYNDPNHADSSLDACASGSNTGGWGVNFVSIYQPAGCASGQAIYYNIHWNGRLTYPGTANGQTVYLNGYNGICLHALPWS